MLLEMIDGGIKEIYSDTWATEGCETCDYGSSYVNEFKIYLTSGTVHIEIDTMYEYALSEGDMMKIILPNVEEIKQMTEGQFCEWIAPKVHEKINENWNSPEEIKIEFIEAKLND